MRIKCEICGGTEHVHFRSSMQYICDKCLYRSINDEIQDDMERQDYGIIHKR